MPTRAQLERLADQAARDAERHEALAAAAREQERELRELAKKAGDTGTVLHSREHSATVNGMEMSDSHATAISRSKRKTKPGSLMDAAYEAGIRSQNHLAEKLGSSSATLSRYLAGRRVPKEFDDKVRTLLPKWSGRWPGGIS